jgi:hemolysin III
MGWLVLIVIHPLAHTFPAAGLALMTAGGLPYTIGALFYIAE